VSLRDLLFTYRTMFYAEIEGDVLEVSENSYVNRKGDKVSEKVLYLHQAGNKSLLEVRVPIDSQVVKGDEFSSMCAIAPWSKDGKSGVFITVRKD